MKTQYAVALALAIGLAGGATSYRLYAAPTIPVYVVVEIDEITDAAAFKENVIPKNAAALVEAQYEDGRYIARTDGVTALDGTPPKYLTILQFQNEQKAKAYYDNMKSITTARMKASKSRAFIVQGVSTSSTP